MRLGIVRRKLDRAAAGGERLVITGLPRARDVGVEFADARLRLSIAWIDSKSGAERLQRGVEASVLLADQAEQVVRLGEVWIESERLDELVARLVKASLVGQFYAGVHQRGGPFRRRLKEGGNQDGPGQHVSRLAGCLRCVRNGAAAIRPAGVSWHSE